MTRQWGMQYYRGNHGIYCGNGENLTVVPRGW